MRKKRPTVWAELNSTCDPRASGVADRCHLPNWRDVLITRTSAVCLPASPVSPATHAEPDLLACPDLSEEESLATYSWAIHALLQLSASLPPPLLGRTLGLTLGSSG